MKTTPPDSPGAAPLTLLSVVIPARDEEGCIASTVEHLHVELRLQNVPHEIVVVDDGSMDTTWKILSELKAKVPGVKSLQNPPPSRFRTGGYLGPGPFARGRRGHHDG